jgi:hypothetical protein
MTFSQLANQNSFVLAAVAVLGGALIALIATRARRVVWLAWVIAVLIAAGLNLAMRTVPPRAFGSVAEVQQALSSGKPTLVEFYSNY